MATYKVKFDVAHPGLNSEASFEIEVNPEWAPLGAKCVPALHITHCRWQSWL